MILTKRRSNGSVPKVPSGEKNVSLLKDSEGLQINRSTFQQDIA